MSRVLQLKQNLEQHFAEQLQECEHAKGEITLEVSHEHLKIVCQRLYDEKLFQFDQLMDVCGVDYLDYGIGEWETENTTVTGFERGVMPTESLRQPHDSFSKETRRKIHWAKPRFAVVYHLLSTKLNHRVRLRSFVDENDMMIDSLIDIWRSADWFEREAFDLYGILFKGHPDLRRILTDYGFIGHPFRKDFPLSGNVEVRYDAKKQRVIYEPVDIEPRVLVPKVIRDDYRYQQPEALPSKEDAAS